MKDRATKTLAWPKALRSTAADDASKRVHAPDAVLDLVARFDQHHESYRASGYNETQLRRDFLDPFFKALGWDMHNEQGYAETYRDVVHEDHVRVAGATKAPDYGFRIGGQRKFFVEAKKPSIRIKSEAAPAYQLRRYAWSAKLSLSILSNFEELAVYDCRIKPALNDSAATARIVYCTFNEYAQNWPWLASTFSRDGILKGSFDKYAETNKTKRGTEEVDNAFLATIEGWRSDLARNLALRNPALDQRGLNFAVQRILDRVIFLRICEDRGLEDYQRLARAAERAGVYSRLGELFREADARYNSGLFHFKLEKGRREPLDEMTLGLAVDDELLRGVIRSLYYPDSPYEFSVLRADILGQVYEQFLGKVIRLTSSHRAVIEDKPEVKKAGGVFYTPSYIVEYIVRQTVGALVEGKSPKQIASLKVLDPACGSGSFLICVYQFMLDWHLDWYCANDPVRHARGKAPVLVQLTGGRYALTIKERKRILLAHCFGVDVDSQAVEVTKLSLLLKVLEGDIGQTLQMSLIRERALPDLGSNIKCGNSLIGSKFFHTSRVADAQALYRINPFDWDGADGFPEIIRSGGFDLIVGNPPYVDIKSLPKDAVRHLFAHYRSANNRVNLFAAFMERALSLCKKTGCRVSMIVPTALLTQESYKPLRQMIVDSFQITNVVRLPNESFGAAAGKVKVDTVIVVLAARSKKLHPISVLSYGGYERIQKIEPTGAHVAVDIPQSQWSEPPDYTWQLNTGTIEDRILAKCDANASPLEECAEICLGLTPYDKYKGHTAAQIRNQVFHADSQKDKTFKPLLAGNDVGRYWVRWNRTQWISYGPWLGAPREQRFFTERRILIKQIVDWSAKRLWAAITDEELYNTQNAFNVIAREGWQVEYLLGVLNSKLMTFYHRKRFLDEFKMRFQKVLIKDCRRFPIRRIEGDSKIAKANHDSVVSRVKQMIGLCAQLGSVRTPQEASGLQRQIAAIDDAIDRSVYALYGLNAEEVGIVDAAVVAAGTSAKGRRRSAAASAVESTQVAE